LSHQNNCQPRCGGLNGCVWGRELNPWSRSTYHVLSFTSVIYQNIEYSHRALLRLLTLKSDFSSINDFNDRCAKCREIALEIRDLETERKRKREIRSPARFRLISISNCRRAFSLRTRYHHKRDLRWRDFIIDTVVLQPYNCIINPGSTMAEGEA